MNGYCTRPERLVLSTKRAYPMAKNVYVYEGHVRLGIVPTGHVKALLGDSGFSNSVSSLVKRAVAPALVTNV